MSAGYDLPVRLSDTFLDILRDNPVIGRLSSDLRSSTGNLIGKRDPNSSIRRHSGHIRRGGHYRFWNSGRITKGLVKRSVFVTNNPSYNSSRDIFPNFRSWQGSKNRSNPYRLQWFNRTNVLRSKPGFMNVMRKMRSDFHSSMFLKFFRQRRLSRFIGRFKDVNFKNILVNFNLELGSVCRSSNIFKSEFFCNFLVESGFFLKNGFLVSGVNTNLQVGDTISVKCITSYLVLSR